MTDRCLNDMRCFRGGLTLGVRKIPFRVFSSNKLPLVATDGRRLALVELEVEFPSSQETEIIVSTGKRVFSNCTL